MKLTTCTCCERAIKADPRIHYPPEKGQRDWLCRECYEKLMARDWHCNTAQGNAEIQER